LAEEPDATIVPLNSNRVDKFRRNFPTAKSLTSRAREIAEGWLKDIDPEDLKIMGYHGLEHSSDYAKMDMSEWIDPEIQEAILYCSEPEPQGLKSKIRQANYLLPYGQSVEIPDVDDPLNKYPLFDNGHYYSRSPFRNAKTLAHARLYMNAAYPLIEADREREAAHEQALRFNLMHDHYDEALAIDAALNV
jgi:hypothetical protein